MTQGRYHTDPEIFFRRQRSGLLSGQRGGPQYPVAQKTMSTITQPESDSKGHPRKRIAVACSRCRKRKIKCSGDRGDGQGCTNCKNSSNGGPACQFLRVSSQDLGSLYPEVSPMAGSQVPYSSTEMGYYNGPYYQQHGVPFAQASRVPRHYASNIHYPGSVAMMSESPARHTDPILDSFPYPSSSPQFSYQTSMYSPSDNSQYYGSSFDFPRQPLDNDFRYSNISLNHGGTATEGHSSFSSMDSLAHSLPGTSAAQRTLPSPRNSAGTLSDVSDQMCQLQPLQQQPILKSQGGGPINSYSSTSLLPPINSETSSPDAVSALPHAHSQQQQRSSMRPKTPNPFSSFSFSSAASLVLDANVGGNASQHHPQTTTTGMSGSGTSSTVLSGNEDVYGGQVYRGNFFLDPCGARSGRSGSSSNSSRSVQYTLASSNSSKRGSQGSLFASFEHGNGNREAKRSSDGNSGSGIKEWGP